MMKSNHKESLYFFFWGIGVLGILWVLFSLVEIARYLIYSKTILWNRVIIGFLLGIGLFLLGRKHSKKYE